MPLETVEIVEFCLDGECAAAGAQTAVRVDDEPAIYDYRLVVAGLGDEQRVFKGSVSTQEYFANGKGCDPRTANATLTVDEDGRITITHP